MNLGKREKNFEVKLCSEVSKDFQTAFERMTEDDWNRLCGDVKADISHNDDDLIWFEKLKERFGL